MHRVSPLGARRRTRRLTLVFVALAALLAVSTAGTVGAAGHVEEVVSYDALAGQFPEGVTVDKVGNVFVSLDAPLGQIRKISPDGSETLFYDFETPGAIGLAVDAPGNVYVARNVAPNNGVYRIDRDGQNAERIPGTEAIVFPNSLAFDKRGNLYVTETFSLDNGAFGDGGVWRIPPGGSPELFVRDPLLSGDGRFGLGFPIGANGIAYRQGALYVANTEQATVVKIPVGPDGGPGEPEVFATVDDDFDPPFPFLPPGLDGLALDVHGDIWIVVITQSRLIRIDAETGDITTVATFDDGLDFPASLAFGTGKGFRQSIYVSNYAIGPPIGAGPGVVRVDVGVPGMPLP